VTAFPTDARAAALRYTMDGAFCLPVPHRSKGDAEHGTPPSGWQKLRLRVDDVERLFPAGQPRNVALLLGRLDGEPGGEVVADLDSGEALRCAPILLPKTGRVAGRPGNPLSHWHYYATDEAPGPAHDRYFDPREAGAGAGGKPLVEILSTGSYVIAPPSTHDRADEQYVWHEYGEPAAVTFGELRAAVRRVAAAALLGRYWPKGDRNFCSLDLAGGLLRAGWTVEQAEQLMRAVCAAAEDEQTRGRLKSVIGTAEKREAGGPTTGWPKLAEKIGGDIVSKVREWLGISTPPEEWREPVEVELPPPAPPPLDALPGPMRDYAAELARCLPCPPDVPAVLSLAVAAQAIGATHRAAVTDDHSEPANLYAFIALPPGTKKSPVLRRAAAALYAAHARMREESKKALRDYEADLKVHAEELNQWKKDYRESGKAAGRPPAEPDRPPRKRLVTTDTTKEAFVNRLVDNPRGIGVFSDELSGFVLSMNQYKGGKGNDKTFWTSLWSGEFFANDRVATSDDVRDGFACIAGMVQPDVLAQLQPEGDLRDGFIDRFLPSYPEPVAPVDTGLSPSVAARDAYNALVERLLKLPLHTDASGASAPSLVPLTDDANRYRRDYVNELAAAVMDDDTPANLKGFLLKLQGYTARLALIIHVCRTQCGEAEAAAPVIDLDSVKAAVAWARYFRAHAERAYRRMGQADAGLEGDIQRVIGWLRRNKGRWAKGKPANVFTYREALSDLRKTFADQPDRLTAVLKRLEERGYVQDVTPTSHGPGRKHKGAYEINPLIDAQNLYTGTRNTINPQNESTSGGEGAISGISSILRTGTGDKNSEAGDDEDGGDGGNVPPATRPPTGPESPRHGHPEPSPIVHQTPPPAPEVLSTACDPPPSVALVATPAYELVTDPAALPAVIQAVQESPLVGLDCETTGLNPGTHRVRLLSLACGPPDRSHVYLLDLFTLDPAPLWGALVPTPIAGHNLAFDLQFLARLGFQPVVCRDTMLMSQVLHAGDRSVRHTLAACCLRELDVALAKEQQVSDWTGALSPEQLDYAATDAEVVRRLSDALAPKLSEAKLWKTAVLENRALPAVAWLAGSGVAVDRPAWEALAERAEADAARLRTELDAMAPAHHRQKTLETGWNWNSHKQVQQALAEMGIGVASTTDEALATVAHPIGTKVRQYRAAKKRATTYGPEWFKDSLREGRVYAGWHQLGAHSGRMISARPNLQNLPRDPAYRRCVIAPEGRTLVKADYSQIELRIAAKVASERNMLNAYRRRDDLHTLTARLVLGKNDVSDNDRQIAKSLNFGLLYGMGASRLKEYALSEYKVALTDEQAAGYRAEFFRAYPGLKRWHARAGLTGDRPIETRTLAGRRRLGVSRFTEKLNTPVQGAGADGLKLACALLWERRGECPDAFPVLAVHDEIVIECGAEQADRAAGWLKRAMEDGMAPIVAPVPVEVEVNVAPTWGG
jgi:DNA polymerase-1